jgi:S-methylmethionine-dependent homocysteine/selenocysteine methylase
VAIAGAMTTLEWCFRPDLAPNAGQAETEYRELAQAFADAGCDLLLVETVNSVADAVAAASAANDVGIPYWMAFVPDQSGKLFSGETLAEACAALDALAPDAVLVNCAPPPDITAGLAQLAPAWSGASGAYAHIGRFNPPEWLFTDEYPPGRYLEVARDWRDQGASIVGGCCGTTPEHIALLASKLD